MHGSVSHHSHDLMRGKGQGHVRDLMRGKGQGHVTFMFGNSLTFNNQLSVLLRAGLLLLAFSS